MVHMVIQVVGPLGTDTMGLHAHLRDEAPMALIMCVGSFTGGDLWVESGGLLNASLRSPILRMPWHVKVTTWAAVGMLLAPWACLHPCVLSSM